MNTPKHEIEVGAIVRIIGPSGHESRVQVKEVHDRDGETVIHYGESPPPRPPQRLAADNEEGTG